MRITRTNNTHQIRCSDHELEILRMAVARLTYDDLPTSGLRRSWARRVGHGGEFLRIDRDKREY